jgi:hypothetical protein
MSAATAVSCPPRSVARGRRRHRTTTGVARPTAPPLSAKRSTLMKTHARSSEKDRGRRRARRGAAEESGPPTAGRVWGNPYLRAHNPVVAAREAGDDDRLEPTASYAPGRAPPREYARGERQTRLVAASLGACAAGDSCDRDRRQRGRERSDQAQANDAHNRHDGPRAGACDANTIDVTALDQTSGTTIVDAGTYHDVQVVTEGQEDRTITDHAHVVGICAAAGRRPTDCNTAR